jgi:glucose/arabinose dehydrogenase
MPIRVLLILSILSSFPHFASALDEVGAALYAERCASCHGRDMSGGNAQSMLDGVWQFGSDDWDLTRNIKHGIAANGMPAYGATFSDDQIAALVRHIKETAAKAGAKRPPLPTAIAAREYDVRVEKWLDGVASPWALTFHTADFALLTERDGRLRVVEGGKLRPQAVDGTPAVLQVGQGGLMDVAFDPDYAKNGWVYLTYSEGLPGSGKPAPGAEHPAMTCLVRGKIDGNRWVENQLLWRAKPEHFRSKMFHFGSRIAFDREGLLYFSVGERGHQEDAQDPHRPNGKIHRVNRDGSIPADNPFADGAKGLASVWSFGHRNPQGLALHPSTGVLWETEHGPMGGDEVNVVRRGANYGWPVATYGVNYDGKIVTEATGGEGIEQPILFWAPSIAVCGIDFVRGDEFPRWRDNLLVTGLGHEELRRLVLVGERVLHQEVLLKNAGRVRDVACGPDGAIYAVLNNPDVVLKLTSAGRAVRQ